MFGINQQLEVSITFVLRNGTTLTYKLEKTLVSNVLNALNSGRSTIFVSFHTKTGGMVNIRIDDIVMFTLD